MSIGFAAIPSDLNEYKQNQRYRERLSEIKKFETGDKKRRYANQFDPRHSVYGALVKQVFPLCPTEFHIAEAEKLAVMYTCGLLTGNQMRSKIRKTFKGHDKLIDNFILLKTQHFDTSAYVLTKIWRVAVALFVQKPCQNCRVASTCVINTKRRDDRGCSKFKPSLTGLLTYYYVGIRDYNMLRRVFSKSKVLQTELRKKYKKAHIFNVTKKHLAAASNKIKKYIRMLVKYGVRLKGKTTAVKFIVKYYNEYELKDVEMFLMSDALASFCKTYGKMPLKKVINTMKSTVKSRLVNFINKCTAQKRSRIFEEDSEERVYVCREAEMTQEGVQQELDALYHYDTTSQTIGRIAARQVFEKTKNLLLKTYPEKLVAKKVAFCDVILNKIGKFMAWAADRNVDLASGESLLKALRVYTGIHPVSYKVLTNIMAQYNGA